MKIKTEFIYPPIPSRNFDWAAWDDDTYDGAPDSDNRNEVGYGRTEKEAVMQLSDIVKMTPRELDRLADEIAESRTRRVWDHKECHCGPDGEYCDYCYDFTYPDEED